MICVKSLGLALLLALVGCGTSNSSLNPQFQPQVANAADTFQFQSTGVTNVTETLSYTWQNTGIAANVDQATTVTAGTAVVVIRDAAGTQVYSAGLQNNGSFQSATGQAGNWTIQVVLQGYSGTLNFRVQKRP
jgi:hypothetical protein